MCAVIADAEPWWPPGTKFGYHAQTFGFLLGETLQRATQQSLTHLLTETLDTGDDVHVAVPPDQLHRVAREVPPLEPHEPPPAPAPGSPLARAMPPGATPDSAFANRDDVLRANIPSMGTMTALGVAGMYASLLDSDHPRPTPSRA